MNTRPQTLTIPSQTHLLFFVMALGKDVMKFIPLAIEARNAQRVADAFNRTPDEEMEDLLTPEEDSPDD